MPRKLIDIESLDLSHDVFSQEEIRSMLPQDHEFKMIDGVCYFSREEQVIVGYKDWDENPWWARGHIPGMPLMPGVLMVEGCAQVATLLMKKYEGWDSERFIGLGGMDRVRFRGQVVPPARVHFVSKVGTRSGDRIAKYPVQAFCNGKAIMEMDLLGILIDPPAPS